jgi:hypothetical protein
MSFGRAIVIPAWPDAPGGESVSTNREIWTLSICCEIGDYGFRASHFSLPWNDVFFGFGS